MPYYATSQEWLRQSSLLLEARPSTTRITTKYNIARPSTKKSKAANTSEETPAAPAAAATEKPARGTLTLKTYDPVSGATLKYKTTKAAEVSRLILSLGRLGGKMAALPEPEGGVDEKMVDVVGAEEEGGAAPSAAPAAAAATPAAPAPQQGGGGGGGKKKKKGKK